ncbi:16S rRNA (guanine(966)-N(2))-methyltransferase RsmD [Salinisphaera sp.]|uniref:16S rRNA (guanine(966)-N(2))-methyltransferase RsmD n=1 Tax=Salinisphaera sp. TaxID=1914330 RepID=UPI002D7722CE|nr:16S rRNA (guanine(966)-N(2))-methyltransferase RsmD [Salinisphaera sp.]HET7313457.1 16S rRNA (guanine(966)-N(2))-methyltransferase RsmD [Salinisphaera sp.]
MSAGKRPNRRTAKPFERETRLRVIGGEWRSRVLAVAAVPGLRPTPNRVRETLFNWLAPRLAGARCIDLFAGTGALGIEALSRGADQAIFVENDRRAAAAIEAALKTLGAGDRARVLQADGTDVGRHLAATHARAPMDIVFVDPPFDAHLHGAALTGLRPLIDPHSRVYVEYPAAEEAAITARLAEEYEILRQSRAAGVGYCLARIRAAGDHGAS